MSERDSHPVLNLRTMIEALILAGILWVGTSVNTLNAQMAAVQVQLADIADVKRRMNMIEIEQARGAADRAGLNARVSKLENPR